MNIENVKLAREMLTNYSVLCSRIEKVNKVTSLKMTNNSSTFGLAGMLKDVITDKEIDLLTFKFKTEVMSILAKHKEVFEAKIKEL